LKGHTSSAQSGAFFFGAKYPMLINEITQRLPTFQAQLKVNGITVTTRVQAASIIQARAMLQHVYGSANVVSLVAVA
jgi:hypothetical protein